MKNSKEIQSQSSRHELNTIIGKGSYIEGKINIQNSIRIDGKIKGDITTTGTLTVGPEGEISGNSLVENAVIGGKIKGTLKANSKVILESSSIFIGDLKTQRITIDEGAVFEGNCQMREGDKPQTPVKKSEPEKPNEP